MEPWSALQCSPAVSCSEQFDIAVAFCVCVFVQSLERLQYRPLSASIQNSLEDPIKS